VIFDTVAKFWSREMVTGKPKRGRPRAIPAELEAVVVKLYETGYGYRKIAKILMKEHGVSANFASIRRLLAKLGKIVQQS
jgi:transposase